jgi:hypothetical protein
MEREPDGNQARRRLRNIVLWLIVSGVLAVAVILARGMGPSRAVVDQMNAEQAGRAAQRASDRAATRADNKDKRQWVLANLSTLAGNILVLAACIVSVRQGASFPRLMGRAALALLGAGLLLFGVAAADKAIGGGEGMFSGERGMFVIIAVPSFLITWVVSQVWAFVVLRRRRRGDPRHDRASS